DSWRYPKLERRLFIQHQRGERHRQQGPRPKCIQQMLDLSGVAILSDEAIWTRIQSVWCLAKEDIAMHKFGSYLDAQMIDKGFDAPTNYRDDRVAWEIVEILGYHFRRLLKHRVQKSPFFGIMADETTHNSTTTQL